jgi:hypothetical protein
VEKPGQRELERTRRAARLRLGLKHGHLHSMLGQNNGGCETVGAGADNASFAGVHVRFSLVREFIGV